MNRNFQTVTGGRSVQTSKDHGVPPGHGIQNVSTHPLMGRGSLGSVLIVRLLHPWGGCMSLCRARLVLVQDGQELPILIPNAMHESQ